MIELNETGLQFTIIYQTVSFSWFFLGFLLLFIWFSFIIYFKTLLKYQDMQSPSAIQKKNNKEIMGIKKKPHMFIL